MQLCNNIKKSNEAVTHNRQTVISMGGGGGGGGGNFGDLPRGGRVFPLKHWDASKSTINLNHLHHLQNPRFARAKYYSVAFSINTVAYVYQLLSLRLHAFLSLHAIIRYTTISPSPSNDPRPSVW